MVRSEAESVNGHLQAVPHDRHFTLFDVVIHPPRHSQFVNDANNGQDSQLLDPVVAFCLPAAHCVHEVPFCPEKSSVTLTRCVMHTALPEI